MPETGMVEGAYEVAEVNVKAAVLLSVLAAAAGVGGAQPPVLDMGMSCGEVGWPARDVMRALGFEVQPSGGGAVWRYAHVYNTRDWRQVWGKTRRPADTSGGLLSVTTRLRPHNVELTLYDYKKRWSDAKGRCEVRLDIDYSGWKETLWAEGYERFRSTGELEARVLDLIRNQVEATLANAAR